jgi:hypothetical protein
LANQFLAVSIEGVVDDPFRRVQLEIVLELKVPKALGNGF